MCYHRLVMAANIKKTTQTKAELQQAFWDLYAQAPLEKISVGQVCQRAGYSRGTFYLHFRDIFELLESIEEPLLDGMARCVEECMASLAKDRGKIACLAALGRVMAFYEANKDYVKVLLGPKGDPEFLRRLKERLKPLWLCYVMDKGQGRSPQEVDLLLEYTLSGTLFMVGRWLDDDQGVSAAQMGHLVYDLAIKDLPRRLD